MGRYTGKKFRLIFMLFLTTTFFFIEIVVGYLTNSMALVADSFHMLSDVISLIIAFISVRMSPEKWSKNTFGWARAEILGALVNAVFLIALCFSIFVEAIRRFFDPEEINNPQLILWVGLSGLIVNVIGLFLFKDHGGHGHSHSSHGHAHANDQTQNADSMNQVMAVPDQDINENSLPDKTVATKEKPKPSSSSQMNMRGVFLHILTDALGSVIVLISAIIIWKTDWVIRLYVDPTLSIIMVVLISYSTWPLFSESSKILLQTVPTHIEVDSLERKLLMNVQGVLAIHELHIWQLAGEKIIATAHILCQNVGDYMNIAKQIKQFFHMEGIHSTTVQLEFVDIQPEGVHGCFLDCPTKDFCLKQTCCGGYKTVAPSQPTGHVNYIIES